MTWRYTAPKSRTPHPSTRIHRATTAHLLSSAQPLNTPAPSPSLNAAESPRAAHVFWCNPSFHWTSSPSHLCNPQTSTSPHVKHHMCSIKPSFPGHSPECNACSACVRCSPTKPTCIRNLWWKCLPTAPAPFSQWQRSRLHPASSCWCHKTAAAYPGNSPGSTSWHTLWPWHLSIYGLKNSTPF